MQIKSEASRSGATQNIGVGRFQCLDAIRGIAAFVVLLWHCYAVCGPEILATLLPVTVSPLRILINGPGAVTLFFVLSGFVLALPYFNNTALSYPAFAIRRVCRIYIPFFAALTGAWLLYLCVPHKTLPAHWVSGLWDTTGPIPGWALFEQFAMIGVISLPDFNLDGPSWSLVHELRLSLILPALVMMMQRKILGTIFAAGMFLFTIDIQSWGRYRSFIDDVSDLQSSLLVTLYLMPCFLLGIALAQHHKWLTSRMRQLHRWQRISLWLCAFAVFYASTGFTLRFLLSTASALVILLTLSSDAATNFLGRAIPAWLGRISYSLYLVHIPILLATIQAINGLVPSAPAANLTILPGAAILSLFMATLFHRWVEAPAIHLGKFISRKLQRPS